MVFSSYEFILIFLPLTFIVFALAQRFGGWQSAFAVLGLASLVFYAQLSFALVTILFASVATNYVIGRFLIGATKSGKPAGWLLGLSVFGNIAALAYFKYSNFLIDITNQISGLGFSHVDIILPIGISFYTFIQIGYLVEAHSGQAEEQPFVKYLVFASFFPCVTAGPLVLQREFFDQMQDRNDSAVDVRRLAVGLTLFAMGLFKKVVLADTIAPYADVAFNGVAAGQSVDMMTAWLGSLSYTLQLYFDFSGYSDMAVGLGIIFGIKLPLNFNSPFKATSISEFWQRWHITMTRFFTKFVYSPMAMNGMRRAAAGNCGPIARFMVTGGWPVVFTMFVAGVWHGSGWTFALYGLLHGLAIAVNNGWKQFNLPKLPSLVAWALTMSVVVSGLAIFRAPDVSTALVMLTSMWGLGLGGVETATAMVALQVADVVPLIALLGAIVLMAPNTQEILSHTWVSIDPMPESFSKAARRIQWRPTWGWSAVGAVILLIAFTNIGADSSFLYYQF